MIAPRHLPRAPIREALIDIRIGQPIPLVSIESAADRLMDSYPIRERLWQREFGFEVVSEAQVRTVTGDKEPKGLRLSSSDGKYVVQFRVDGFSLSRLNPYETWEAMRDMAQTAWDVFVDVVQPDSVSRLAVRYINLVELPVPSDLSQYLTCAPKTPPSLPENVASFLTRIVMPEVAPSVTAIVTQSLQDPVGMKAPLLLDIDVFKEGDFLMPCRECWDGLEDLHEMKNQIFFNLITERTAEMFA